MKKIKATFVYLTRSSFYTNCQLIKSLLLLHLFFNWKFRYKVTIFHESNYPVFYKILIKIIFSNVIFREIDFSTPSEFKDIVFRDPFKNMGFGYRNMCNFFNSEFFTYLNDFDWYCRLDTDSYLLSNLKFDFFEFMEKKSLKYGYIGETNDDPGAVIGLGDFILDYITRFDIDLSRVNLLFDKSTYNLRMIYNNFEVVNLEIFKEESVINYLSELKKSGFIYQYRWGDAPLRTFMVSLFLEKNQIVRFDNIDYEHKPFIQKGGKIESPITYKSTILQNNWIGINATTFINK